MRTRRTPPRHRSWVVRPLPVLRRVLPIPVYRTCTALLGMTCYGSGMCSLPHHYTRLTPLYAVNCNFRCLNVCAGGLPVPVLYPLYYLTGRTVRLPALVHPTPPPCGRPYVTTCVVAMSRYLAVPTYLSWWIQVHWFPVVPRTQITLRNTGTELFTPCHYQLGPTHPVS